MARRRIVKKAKKTEPGKRLGTMDIYKHQGVDCSNGGISSKYDDVVIWSKFDKKAPKNAVVLVKREWPGGEYDYIAEPARHRNDWNMYGGCFIYTCNAVVPCHGEPIKLHDRVGG